ncbi:unnamed protein product [Psylliodes chrysocephalus]|uniref:Uncharacterized protein n=1 Tax=Psylliodes chrysocephalus TaxID=3402493 RepID=A0A9P0GFP1_9CUCU|nr:unnamed protein product [Psylliodes chrysocephala]
MSKFFNFRHSSYAKDKCLLWFCDVCLDEVYNNGGIRNEIESLKQSVSEEIELCSSYRRSSIKTKNTDQACSKKTFEAVQKYLNPTLLQLGINEIRNVKDDDVVIKCNSNNEIEKVKSAVEKSYNIVSPDLKNTSIKVVDIENEMSPEDLINCIKKQNGFLNDGDSNISIKVFKK